MITLNYKLLSFSRRLVFFICCNLFDVLILFQGHGIRPQITLIALYRFVIYTPQSLDLAMFMVFGFFWDAIYNSPPGFHSFLLLVTFFILDSQRRYLFVSHQYMRWLVFLGVLILFIQIEYTMHFLIGQQIALSLNLVLSILISFSFYPFIFKFLQHHDR